MLNLVAVILALVVLAAPLTGEGQRESRRSILRPPAAVVQRLESPDQLLLRMVRTRARGVGHLLGLLALAMFAPRQPAQTPRVVLLSFASEARAKPAVAAFQQGLKEFGYAEGQTITVEYRFADGRDDHLPGLAATIVRSEPQAIVTSGARVVRVLRAATATIPIVVAVMGDPVGQGVIASYAHPGGNVTGIAFQDAELLTKRIQLIRETLPSASRVALFDDSGGPASVPATALTAGVDAARALGLRTDVIRVKRQEDFAGAFDAARRTGAQAVVQLASPFSVCTVRRSPTSPPGHGCP